jgi:transposase
MRDTDFYRQILGLESPWSVDRVNLDLSGGRVDVHVKHDKGARWVCPQCDRKLACRDHSPERTWRHLDTCQFQTYVHGRVPRVDCPDHGVVQAKVPWAEDRSRFTLLFERFAIDVIHESATILGACRLLGIRWDACWGIMERAVRRGQARKQEEVIPVLCVDEKAVRKGHDYVTLVCDYATSTVAHVEDGRKAASLGAYFEGLTEEQLAGIEAISMDMWEPYVQATLAHVPDARSKIVFDRFHIMKQMTHAVDLVRRAENRELRSLGDDRLVRTRYLWLYSEENLPDKHRDRFEDLKQGTLKVARAWAIKECLRSLWSYRSEGWARKYFRKWFHWATHSRLTPVRNVAHMINVRLRNVLTYCRLQLTTSVAEGLNSKITAIKTRACGYRNREHFKTAIYFFCGGLDLYPR